MEQSPNPDEHFELLWQNNTVRIEPRMKALQPVNKAALKKLAEELLPPPGKPTTKNTETGTTILVFSTHKYYQHLQVNLYETAIATNGKIKNPLKQLDVETLVWTTSEAAAIKFYTGVATFFNNHEKLPEVKHLLALRAMLNNPLALTAFYHNPQVSEHISATSLVPVELNVLQTGLQLSVYLKSDFYEISGQLTIGDKTYPLNSRPTKSLERPLEKGCCIKGVIKIFQLFAKSLKSLQIYVCYPPKKQAPRWDYLLVLQISSTRNTPCIY